jgi:hypothetical protein
MATGALNFAEEVELLLRSPLIGKGEVAIWGGTYAIGDIERFLLAWKQPRMPYRIWEYTHRMDFEIDTLPAAENYALLDRGRLFGVGGDLTLRRDGDQYRWHFIGEPHAIQPVGFDVKDFWTDSPECQAGQDVKLRQQKETALLWGAYTPGLGRWHDDRVGWAKLSYPINAIQAKRVNKRVKIDYTVFTDEGQVAFVWLQELREYA